MVSAQKGSGILGSVLAGEPELHNWDLMSWGEKSEELCQLKSLFSWITQAGSSTGKYKQEALKPCCGLRGVGCLGQHWDRHRERLLRDQRNAGSTQGIKKLYQEIKHQEYLNSKSILAH